ncbi:MAG: hypothetical protein WA231_04585 [Methylocella sp.]
MHEKVRGARDAQKEIGYFIQGVVSEHTPAVNAKTKPLSLLIAEFRAPRTPSAIDDRLSALLEGSTNLEFLSGIDGQCSGQRAHEQFRQMRWSPRGAQRALQARAVVIYGRLDSGAINLVA